MSYLKMYVGTTILQCRHNAKNKMQAQQFCNVGTTTYINVGTTILQCRHNSKNKMQAQQFCNVGITARVLTIKHKKNGNGNY